MFGLVFCSVISFVSEQDFGIKLWMDFMKYQESKFALICREQSFRFIL